MNHVVYFVVSVVMFLDLVIESHMTILSGAGCSKLMLVYVLLKFQK